jgi:hypothetical protein
VKARDLWLATVVLAMLAFAAGCGGADDSTASAPVTKAAFIKRADLICSTADVMQPEEADAFAAKHGKETEKMTPVASEEVLVRGVTLPSVKGEIKEIESLEAPDGEEKEVNAIIAGWRLAVRRGEKAPYSVTLWNKPAKDPFTKINKIAVRYGFSDCEDLR